MMEWVYGFVLGGICGYVLALGTFWSLFNQMRKMIHRNRVLAEELKTVLRRLQNNNG